MPELPEAETIKRELEKTVLGKKIIGVIVNNPQVVKEPKKDKFVKGLKNLAIRKILRKGKALIFELSNGKSLVVHLRMTGQLIYPGIPSKSRVSFRLSDKKFLDYRDRRLLGEVRLVDNWQDMKFFKELGPEIYDLTKAQFNKMLSGKTTKIKPLLMDQKFLSGVGNLYAAEALFRSGIHPARAAKTLSVKEKQSLYKEIKDTLSEAIRYKGSSVDQYVRLSGQSGDYVRYHKVYDRGGEPCLRCRTEIKRIALGGRGTYFCPRCQPAYVKTSAGCAPKV